MKQTEANYTAIAHNVKQRRSALCLSQEQLAERADLSIDTVKNIEAGRGAMRLDTYLRVVEALGTTFEMLLGAESDPQQVFMERMVWITAGRSENEIRFILHIVEQTLEAKDLYMKGPVIPSSSGGSLTAIDYTTE